jgi:hypothetical protein
VVARSHAQLVASGGRLASECGLAQDGQLLTAVPLASFAGLSASLLPWLIGGGTLSLHHGFSPETFAAQAAALDGGAVVVPAAALPAVSGLLGSAATAIALWRAPERMQAAPAQTCGVIDVGCFGESGLLLTQRDADGAILPLPFGADTQRTRHGTLALRASGTQVNVVPAADAESAAAEPFVDTGYACQADPERGTLTITAGPAGLAGVGGYRFVRSELDATIAEADPAATIAALPHALLGERLAGNAPDADGLEIGLTASGLNPLIATAFRPRRSAAGSA